jgi:tRNA A37 threonylcarbamoyladenosine dehydratase
LQSRRCWALNTEAIVAVEERNKKSIVGTISYVPAVFGCACAQVAIEEMLGTK